MERGEECVVASIILTALALIAVLLRCVSRFIIMRNAGIDDDFIIIALVISIACTTLVVMEKPHGLGQHIINIAPSDLVILSKTFYASILCYYLSLTIVKTSILLQFLRFFIERSFRRMCYCLMIFIHICSWSVIIASIFLCTPIPYFWDKSIKGGECIDFTACWFFAAAFSIVSDLAMVALPIPVLRSLHLPPRQKWTLLLIFAVSGLCCIITILRLRSLYIISTSKDITWDNTAPSTWSVAEVNVGIICACLPTFKPLVNKLFPRLLQEDGPKAPIEFTGINGMDPSIATIGQKDFRTRFTEVKTNPNDPASA